MRVKTRALSTRNWKVSTPREIIPLFWKITNKHKNLLYSVLDMGAGDGRLSQEGKYKKYIGVEIDKKIKPSNSSANTSFEYGCVFEHKGSDYSACIGNPPYLRHNEISNNWREKISKRFIKNLNVKLDLRSNLYNYFILLGLQKTEKNGLVSLLIPYEWAFLPSAKPLRNFILANGWSVNIYRFNYLLFKDALTTASICIINKSTKISVWKYFDISVDNSITEVNSFTEDGEEALDYQERGEVWAMRGLSPGSKNVFTLTEEERKKYNLSKNDVRPCVTSFKELPGSLIILNNRNFEKYFVSQNRKCWLIKTDKKMSERLKKYVKNVPADKRNSWTCKNQEPWYRFNLHPSPMILMSSAFKASGPRIIKNEIKAIAVGSVVGIHSNERINIDLIHMKLLEFDFKSRIVSREEGLKKVAIKQVNTVLNNLLENKNA